MQTTGLISNLGDFRYEIILTQFLNNFEHFSKDPQMRKIASSNKTVFHILHIFFEIDFQR